jgi:cytoskeleton protein RodZ
MAANEDDGSSRRRIHLREISGDADAPLETVGQDLRAARIRRGDDLAVVSRALKIRKDHLDALENDRQEDLPGRTYAIGFVRSYARYLGLDVNVLVDRFKAEIAGRGDEHALPATNLLDDDGRRLPNGWRILAAIVGIALLWGVWHIFFAARDAAPPVPPPPSLASNNAARITDAPKPVTPPPATDAAATPPQPADAAPQAAVTPPPAATAQPNPQSSPVAVPAVPQGSQADAPQSSQVFGQQNRDGGRVALRAKGATRITVRGADGRLYINRDLAPGEVYYVPNLPGLSVATSNAGALEVDLDGVSLGRAGAQSQVLGKIALDPQSLSDRFNNR